MVMILSLATSLFGRSYNALLPVFAKDTLDVGIQGLGMMNSAPGAGSILGAVLIGMNLRLPPNGVLSLGGMAALALLLIGFASSESYALSLVLLFLLGVLGTALITATRTILQLKAPRAYMGRVMSLSTIAVIGFGPLGGFIVGPIAEFAGAREALYISAAWCSDRYSAVDYRAADSAKGHVAAVYRPASPFFLNEGTSTATVRIMPASPSHWASSNGPIVGSTRRKLTRNRPSE